METEDLIALIVEEDIYYKMYTPEMQNELSVYMPRVEQFKDGAGLYFRALPRSLVERLEIMCSEKAAQKPHAGDTTPTAKQDDDQSSSPCA